MVQFLAVSLFKNKEKPLIYTNLFMLVPLFISFKTGQFGVGYAILTVTTLSLLYHIFKKPGNKWWWQNVESEPIRTLLSVVEMISAFSLGIWGFLLLINKPNNQIVLILAIFIPSFLMFLVSDRKKYVLLHSIWHVAVAIIATLVLI